MKIISTVVYFMIAGILSTSIAQESTESAQLEASDSGRTDDFTNANSVLSFITQLEKLEVMKTGCEKNGGPKAYNNCTQSFGNFGRCIAPVEATLKPEADGASTQIIVESYLKKFCPNVSEIEDCLETIKEPFAACLEPKERNNLKIFYKMTNSVFDFVCADKARRITEFLENDGLECWLSKQGDFKNCTNQTINAVPQKSQIIQSPFEHEQCTAFENLQHCWVGALKNCENQKPSSAVDSLFNLVIQQTPCKDLLKSSSAHINLLSTTVLMGIVMFVRFA